MPGVLQLRVVTPERLLFEGEVFSVVAPAHDGEVGILPRHAPLLASLGIGELRAKSTGGLLRFFVDGGFLQVRHDRVTALCDRASRLEEANLATAEAEAQAARSAGAPDAARLQQRATVLRRILDTQPAAH